MAEPKPGKELSPALVGFRVLELTTMLAGPMAGMLLADHGADVIKIELPGAGDGMRQWGHLKHGHGLFWKMISRNKKLITLDVRRPKGRDLFLALVARSDVLIENFRPGTLDRWGLDWTTLMAANPRLVVLRISGFGQSGPKSRQPGFGSQAESLSGFAAINGWPDRSPVLPPFGLADSIAGITGAFGVLAALLSAQRLGVGQEIDIALYEPILTTLGPILIDYDQLGIVQTRTGNSTPHAAPRGAYLTREKEWIAISCANQNTTERLFETMGQPDLIIDDRFSDNGRRLKNRDALDQLVTEWCSNRSLTEALDELDAHGVPACPFYDAVDILGDEHFNERGSIVTIPDADLGDIQMQAPIPKMSGTPPAIRFAGGKIAQDNHDVYGGLLGLSTEAIAGLAAEKII